MSLESNLNNIDVSPWLKNLPVAPEYYPTLAEFQDPISYIFKIEKEAYKYGICKIIPPVPSASKKIAIANFNRSLLARAGDHEKGEFYPVFSTRQQQIGFCPRKHHRPVQKPVWESGESYTLGEFEAKAKLFEKSFLRKGLKKCFSVLEIESIYWKATLDKAFSVEYANDMPGSAFIVRKDRGEGSGSSVGNGNVSVGETDWNMRGVSRAKGSLLRFMKEEIPGVTSPMVYIAMLFSWFAWHVEDHDLHSLNYLHTGAAKTWYGVPREAAVAFEEVIRVHGYGGEINPLVTFATLAEKTTVMSPEVLVNAGVPCCRLVQNPGEFVVTFPRAYHSGFSHGFNLAEASNIATPEWLVVAKDAAVRRASINCPPMVSHFQLLYDLALSLCSRVPNNIHTEPRSSRLKDKKKGVGDILIKDLFVQDVLQNNSLFHTIGKGSSIIILPQVKSGSTLPGGSLLKVKSRLPSLGSPDLVITTRKGDIADSLTPRYQDNRMTGSYSVKGKYSALRDENLPVSCRADQVVSTLGSQSRSMGAGRDGDHRSDRVSNQGLFSCVTCGILCFSSVAVIQPTETASQYLISGDCSKFTDCVGTDGLVSFNEKSTALELDSSVVKPPRALFDIPIQIADQNQPVDVNNSGLCDNSMTNGTSLGLLAMTYGDCTDSEDDGSEADEECEKVGNGYNRSEGGENKSFDFRLDVKISSPSVPSANSNCDHGVYMHSESKAKQVAPTLDEDSSRMHIFCLQHAVQVEKQLRTIGGAHVILLCHPDYPMLEAQAKQVADELGNDNNWNDISYREANLEDEEIIQSALDCEEAVHGNGDWAVKLGINLYYSANLSRSPLYSKQMPYNSMIYSAFGRKNPDNTSNHGSWSGRYRKGIVAGKWCGKVWTASQVHPMLTEGELDEEDHRRNLAASKKPSFKIERSLAGPKTDDFTPRKSRRKRKPTAKASKVVEVESPDDVLDNLRVSVKRTKISSRNRKVRKETFDAQISDKETDSQPEDDSPDEVLESRRISVKRPKIPTRNMKVRKETFEPLISDRDTDLQPEDDCLDKILESRRISVKRPKIPSRNMKLRKETFEPLISDQVSDSQPEDDSPDEVLESRRISVKRPKIPSRNMKVRKETCVPLISDQVIESQPDDDSPDEVLESRRISVKRPKIPSRNMKVRKETFEPLTSDKETDSQPDDDRPDEVLGSWRVSVKRPKISSRNMEVRKETFEPQINDKETDSQQEDELEGGPSTRLRRRTAKAINESGRNASTTGKARNVSGRKAEATAKQINRPGRMTETNPTRKRQPKARFTERAPEIKDSKNSKMRVEAEYQCDIENCTMSFETKQELALHKRNVCPVKGCGKDFFSHKYLVQHRRVHMDDRPLKCPWKGCKMTFKWAWARTEHIRVHTGERPYLCTESGCGQTFRFVSDFSRHKRKTGHSTKKVKK